MNINSNANSHRVMGINYFKQKAIAFSVVLVIVFLTVWLTRRGDSSTNAETVNDKGGGLPAQKVTSENSVVNEKMAVPPKGGVDTKTGGRESDGSGNIMSPADREETHEFESDVPDVAPPSVPSNRSTEISEEVKTVTFKSKIAFDRKENKLTWDSRLKKADKLVLEISDTDGNTKRFTVTGADFFVYDPQDGNMQAKRMYAKLIATDGFSGNQDSKIALTSEDPFEFFPKCSAQH